MERSGNVVDGGDGNGDGGTGDGADGGAFSSKYHQMGMPLLEEQVEPPRPPSSTEHYPDEPVITLVIQKRVSRWMQP